MYFESMSKPTKKLHSWPLLCAGLKYMDLVIHGLKKHEFAVLKYTKECLET